jgi:hypothetical protein
MIVVKKELFEQCNVCHSTDETVKTILFKYDGSAGGTSVMLCATCRKELIKVLQTEENNI